MCKQLPSPTSSPSRVIMGNITSVRRYRQRNNRNRDTLYTKPTGLYPTCPWSQKAIRRQIYRGDLAPTTPGQDTASPTAKEECPICMLVYPALNTTRCCTARLCTECYLQIRPPRHNRTSCPFCKHRRLEILYLGPLPESVLLREASDERRAAAASRRHRDNLQPKPPLPQPPLDALASDLTYCSQVRSVAGRCSAASSGPLDGVRAPSTLRRLVGANTDAFPRGAEWACPACDGPLCRGCGPDACVHHGDSMAFVN